MAFLRMVPDWFKLLHGCLFFLKLGRGVRYKTTFKINIYRVAPTTSHIFYPGRLDEKQPGNLKHR